MNNASMIFKSLAMSTVIAVGGISIPGAASANGCPSNTVWNGYQCIAPPGGGEAGSNNTNTNSNANENWNGNQNTNWNGQGQQQGQTANGGNASSNSGAVSGSNSSATTGNQSTSVNAGGGKGGDAHASGGSVSGSGNSSSTVKGSGNSRQSQSSYSGGNSISIKNRVAAASALAAPLSGNFTTNCFGDMNPSGKLSLAVQALTFGAGGSSEKASNVCAIARLQGEEAALRYIAAMDPSANRMQYQSKDDFQRTSLGTCKVVERSPAGKVRDILFMPKKPEYAAALQDTCASIYGLIINKNFPRIRQWQASQR